jgi:hypothetical protein
MSRTKFAHFQKSRKLKVCNIDPNVVTCVWKVNSQIGAKLFLVPSPWCVNLYHIHLDHMSSKRWILWWRKNLLCKVDSLFCQVNFFPPNFPFPKYKRKFWREKIRRDVVQFYGKLLVTLNGSVRKTHENYFIFSFLDRNRLAF